MEQAIIITPLDPNGLDNIKKYLEAVKELCNGKLANIESFLLEHGKAFENQRSFS